jgi:hypothetical protein
VEKKPIFILIHGFGATEKSWTNPYEEFLGKGKIPFDYVLADYGGKALHPILPLVAVQELLPFPAVEEIFFQTVTPVGVPQG